MSRFGEELRVIPRTAWVIAFLAYFAFTTLIFNFALPSDPNLSKWPLAGKIAFVYGMFLLVFALVLLVGYVYADARRREMRYVMWTWLAALIPDGIGIILYFILRDPLPSPCPKCKISVPAKFTFCPHCGAALRPCCPQCGKAIEHGWQNCAYCGTRIGAAA